MPRRSSMRAVEWTAAYINDLPDSAFLVVESGEKDDAGKTTPRSLRHFPVRDAAGAVDMPHLRNALARIPQSDIDEAAKESASKKADALMEEHGEVEMADRRRALAEADAPSYREGEEGRRCLECVHHESRWNSEPSAAMAACRLYAFDTATGYKPWFVCDSYRSRAAMMYADAPLRLTQVGDKEEDGSVWIEILRTGTHHAGHVGGTASSGQDAITVDADMLASLARGTAAVLADGRYPSGIPVRIDPTHADDSGPACGRIREVRVEGDVLLARVAWTARGRETIEAGEYDSVSIEAEPPGSVQDKRTGKSIDDWALTGLVVTNHPFIAGMAPLAASDRKAKEADMSLLKLILPALALAEGATEAQAVAAVQVLVDKARRADALAASVATLTADRDAQATALAAAERSLRERRLDDACAAGRITAAERERYGRVLASLGETETNAIFTEGRVKTSPVGASGSGAAAAQDAQTAWAADYDALIMAGKPADEAYRLSTAKHRGALNAHYREN